MTQIEHSNIFIIDVKDRIDQILWSSVTFSQHLRPLVFENSQKTKDRDEDGKTQTTLSVSVSLNLHIVTLPSLCHWISLTN